MNIFWFNIYISIYIFLGLKQIHHCFKSVAFVITEPATKEKTKSPAAAKKGNKHFGRI